LTAAKNSKKLLIINMLMVAREGFEPPTKRL
jgi:hypothetical protein